jgi:hypothetical protein
MATLGGSQIVIKLNIIRSLSCVWLDAFKMIINKVERYKLIPDITAIYA